MSQLAKLAGNDPGFVAFSLSLRSSNDSDSIASLDGWLRSNYTYRPESEEIIRSPEFMLSDNVEGDCDDVSTFTAAVLKVLGISARLHAIRTQYNADFDHVFTEARIGQFWIPIDPTVVLGMDYRQVADLLEYV
jgi:transglutaminase-like putative cysteine protease